MGFLCLSLFVMLYFCLVFYQFGEEETVGCFVLIVLRMSCSVTLPYCAFGLSAVCDCGIS